MECPHCVEMSLTSLCSRRAYFLESNSTPRALKNLRGRGSQSAETSELTPAQTLRSSFSPPKEADHVFFSRGPSCWARSMTPPSLSLVNPASLSQARMPTFSASYQELWMSWAWSGLHRRSPPTAAWISGSCHGAVSPLVSEFYHSS